MAAGKPKREKWSRIILLMPAAYDMSAPAHLFIRDTKGQTHLYPTIPYQSKASRNKAGAPFRYAESLFAALW